MGYIKKSEFPRPKPIKRTCLKCDREFVAEGRFNRICVRCRESDRELRRFTLHRYVVGNIKARRRRGNFLPWS